MYVSGLTDVGKNRNQNQDAIYFSADAIGPLPNLFIVADGMGGHNAGDVASTKAVQFVTEYVHDFKAAEFVLSDNYLDLLVSAVQYANKKVCEMAESNPNMQGMGTTLTACVVTNEKIILAHVGDSRAYSVSLDKITQLTADHSYVGNMVQSGQITAEEALTHPNRHMITRVLGMPESFEVDGIVLPIGDTASILLCSDGLTNMIDDNGIKQIVDGTGFVEDRVKFLVEEANMRGGLDNISVVLVDVNR